MPGQHAPERQGLSAVGLALFVGVGSLVLVGLFVGYIIRISPDA